MHDPYTPPAAALQNPAEARHEAPFHVVSPTKLVVLYFATLGLYQLYWFYMHWRRWRVARRETVWPVARAIFSLLFVHALARRIDRTARATGTRRDWWPMTVATVFVGMEVLNYGSVVVWEWPTLRLSSAWWWIEWLGFAVMPITAACLVRLQCAANAACGDPQARGNRRFTRYNLAWIVLFIGATAYVVYDMVQTGGF